MQPGARGLSVPEATLRRGDDPTRKDGDHECLSARIGNMPIGKNLSVIVPLYNEIGNVPRLKADLLPVLSGLGGLQDVELVLVDDGSTDGTNRRNHRRPAHV